MAHSDYPSMALENRPSWLSLEATAPEGVNDGRAETIRPEDCARRLQGAARRRGLPASLRAREVADRAGQDASFTDQRLRLLPQHAQQGCAPRRRDRTTALSAQRLARSVDLHAARACRARLDGGADPRSRDARTRRRLRKLAPALQ